MSAAPEPRAVERGHELDTTHARRVLLAVCLLAAAIGVVLVACWYLRGPLGAGDGAKARKGATEDVRPAAPAPDFGHARNWVRRADAPGNQRAEARQLSSYGWVDREEDVIHVPVERAIELLLSEGLRVEPPPPPGEERP